MPEEEPRLTHLDDSGNARMVDVGEKQVTVREAEARGSVAMLPDTLRLIREGSAVKGDVLGVARIAGILAAKRTAELIPLCHTLSLSAIELEFSFREDPTAIEIAARARTSERTGIEMEALTAVSIAGLTIYDMCKSVDRGMRIGDIHLTYKSGGKSGVFRAD